MLVDIRDIDKAAEVVTDDSFGMLNYTQALTLMVNDDLRQVVDGFRKDGTIRKEFELKHLALLHFVKGTIIGNPDSLEELKFSSSELQDIVDSKTMHQQLEDNTELYIPIINTKVEEGDAVIAKYAQEFDESYRVLD